MTGWDDLGMTSAVHTKASLRALWGDAPTGPAPRPNAVSAAERLSAMLTAEREAHEQGFALICGVDEAGRGPLAGPLVAGAARLLEPESLPEEPGGLNALNDSKQLSEGQREALFDALIHGPHVFSACVVTAAEIDRGGIQQANYGAMSRAALALKPAPDYILVDGYRLPGMRQPCLKMVKGDRRSLSIAAASIVAKVVRDHIMVALDAKYPEYGFVNHKGYATPEHLDAIAKHGPCPIHRLSFAPLAKTAETGMLFT